MILVLLSALAGCGSHDAEADAAPEGVLTELPDAPGTRIEAATVRSSSSALRLELPANVAARSDATLASPMGGYVESVAVEAGDHVRKGQVLARIDSATRRYQFDIAEAQALQAEAEWARIQKLGDAVSEQQALQVETQAKVARANADMAKLNLNRSVVTASFGGEVASVHVDPGEVAGPGTPVVRLVQTDAVLLELSVSDRDISQLAPGQAVSFRSQSVAGRFEGKVTSIAPAANQATRTFEVEVLVPNPEGTLRPGMLGRVSLDTQVADEAIVIPQDWLVTRLDGSGVFLVNEAGVAEWREVEVTAFNRDQAIIGSGLSDGDRVVTVGQRELAEGDPLLVVREGTCCDNGRIVY